MKKLHKNFVLATIILLFVVFANLNFCAAANDVNQEASVIVNSGKDLNVILKHNNKKINKQAQIDSMKKYTDVLVKKYKIDMKQKYAINNFIVYGTKNTQKLSIAERADKIKKYFEKNKMLPRTENEWKGVLNLTSEVANKKTNNSDIISVAGNKLYSDLKNTKSLLIGPSVIAGPAVLEYRDLGIYIYEANIDFLTGKNATIKLTSVLGKNGHEILDKENYFEKDEMWIQPRMDLRNKSNLSYLRGHRSISIIQAESSTEISKVSGAVLINEPINPTSKIFNSKQLTDGTANSGKYSISMLKKNNQVDVIINTTGKPEKIFYVKFFNEKGKEINADYGVLTMGNNYDYTFSPNTNISKVVLTYGDSITEKSYNFIINASLSKNTN